MTKLLNRMKRLAQIAKAIAAHPIHKHRKLASVIDWARLAIASRLTPARQIAIPFVDGTILNWPAESSSVMICARYGLGEYADMAFVLHLLRKTDLFCDIGANAGVYTVLAGGAVGSRVFAAEPVPRTFDLLMQNIYANHLSEKTDARNIGIGSKAGRLYFTTKLWSYNHVVEEGEGDAIEIEVATLDEALNGQTPAILKIDVEGFEAQVVSGAMKTISNNSLLAVILEMCHGHLSRYGDTVEKVQSSLLTCGLSGPYWYNPETKNILPAGQQEVRKFNQIFLRDRERVLNRLQNSKQYTIHRNMI